MIFQKIRIFLLLLALIIPSITTAVSFERIKKIGDDRENYLFLSAVDTVITEKKEIIVLDMKGNRLTIYDWSGKFLKRIGQVGQGPGDFYYPIALDYYKGKIYVNDKGNKRIVEIDATTYEMKFYKQTPGNDFNNEFMVLPSLNFLGHFSHASLKHGRIAIVDKKWDIRKFFFKKFPVEMKPVDLNFDNGESAERVARSIFVDTYSAPKFAFDEARKEILVTFAFPDNPMVFFVYDTSGKLIKKFSYPIKDKRFRFNDFTLTASIATLRNANKYPDENIPTVRNLAIYEEKYFAFFELIEKKKNKELRNRRFCLIFDRQGVPLEHFEDKNRISHRCGSYFSSGLLENDDLKVCIFKFHMKKSKAK